MARFVDWWSLSSTTPADVAAAAARADVLVETGSDYAVAWVDFGDGDDRAPILAPGSVCSAAGATWLVYPGAGAHEGWLARVVQRAADGQVLVNGPAVELGPHGAADQIVAALLNRPRPAAALA